MDGSRNGRMSGTHPPAIGVWIGGSVHCRRGCASLLMISKGPGVMNGWETKPVCGFAPRMELPRPGRDGLKGRPPKVLVDLIVVVWSVIIHAMV